MGSLRRFRVPKSGKKRVLKRGQKPPFSYTVNSGDFVHPGDIWNDFWRFSPKREGLHLYFQESVKTENFGPSDPLETPPRPPRDPPKTGPFRPPSTILTPPKTRFLRFRSIFDFLTIFSCEKLAQKNFQYATAMSVRTESKKAVQKWSKNPPKTIVSENGSKTSL